MPLRLDIKKKLSARSDRVKCVDMHPEEPWVLSALYNGNVYIWNYANQNLVKSFEVTDLPVRTAKFISRKQWIIAGSDDMFLRVFNYNTMEKLKAIDAHSDYIRCVVVHPTLPYVLSSADDMLIKLWDWDKGWANIKVFEGHSHYVMMLAINPKDSSTFASASLDRTIKVWRLGTAQAHFTLEGHEKGVNCVEYFVGGDKPFLVSGADDKLLKVWDYQNKTCVQTLEGHVHNVSMVCYHPELPIIVSGSEDGTIRIWNANTYRLERTLNYGLERVWSVAYLKGSSYLALGFDEATVVLKLGREEPTVSMDQSGKIIWARHNEIQTVNVKSAAEADIADGERISLITKELGNCEIFPQSLQHSPNGRFVAVCGDGEYIIFTALAWRNKAFGQALEVVWSSDSSLFAVRESTSKIKIFKNFKEVNSFRPNYSPEGIFGGNLLGVKDNGFVCLYDWEECKCIRKIDVVPKNIYWNDSGTLVAIACESAFYLLKYVKDAVNNFLSTGATIDEDGIEESFEILHDINERVRTAIWVGDCFVYTNNNSRLNYCVGSEVVTIAHLDRQMYLLGYLPRDNRLYLIDKNYNVACYGLQLAVINYQTAVLRGDLEEADRILPLVPMDQRSRVAHFLDSQGLKRQALQVSVDPDHRFELAIQLEELEVALEVLKQSESEQKWKQLGDIALSNGKLDLAEQCMLSAEDLNGLLLLYSSIGTLSGMNTLAQMAIKKGKNNIAFMCYLLTRQVSKCLDLLCETGRIPEAAFFARTYLPSEVPRIVKLWRRDLQTINEKAAESLADPTEYENLFPDLHWALQAEEHFKQEVRQAAVYPEVSDEIDRDLIKELKSFGQKNIGSPKTFNGSPKPQSNQQVKTGMSSSVSLTSGSSPSGLNSINQPQQQTQQQPNEITSTSLLEIGTQFSSSSSPSPNNNSSIHQNNILSLDEEDDLAKEIDAL